MSCQNCYWYNPEADGSGCIVGRETPRDDCADFYEDWQLLAEISPADPRLPQPNRVVVENRGADLRLHLRR